MEAKYIIINRVFPIIFTGAITHLDEAANRKVTSAGFCRVYVKDGEVDVLCWGESFTLNIKSKPELDEKLIKSILKG